MGKLVTAFEGRSCCDVWLQATDYIFGQRMACYNVVLGVEQPVQMSPADFEIYDHVDQFLGEHDANPLSTVATTIFPASEYLHGGAREVYDQFPKVLEKAHVEWGTYAGRMLARRLRRTPEGPLLSPLEQIVSKMKGQLETQRMRSVYEVSLVTDEDIVTEIPTYDALHDCRRVRGGPCLTHLSFKLATDGKVLLTALYRSHYYIARALGNLLGLAQLLAFVAREVGAGTGSLVCHSTYATIDTEGGWSRAEVGRLIEDCKQAASVSAP